MESSLDDAVGNNIHHLVSRPWSFCPHYLVDVPFICLFVEKKLIFLG